jgi:hypothetical protein
MKTILPDAVEKGRIRIGSLKSTAADGNNGAFFLKTPNGVMLQIIASDGMLWEHVSVTTYHKPYRCPTWDEMCWVKDQFWDESECVIEYHLAAENYVDMHPFVLHLWKPTGVEIPIPPMALVGWGKKRRK